MVSLPINFGLTSAIQVGMKYAKENGYDIAIQFDGDGQHDAKYLKKLVKLTSTKMVTKLIIIKVKTFIISFLCLLKLFISPPN